MASQESVQQPYGYPPVAPAPQPSTQQYSLPASQNLDRPTTGQVVTFVIAAVISAGTLLSILLTTTVAFLNDNAIGKVALSIYGVVAFGLTALFVTQAIRKRFRYSWSIWLLVLNVAVPALFIVGFIAFIVIGIGAIWAVNFY